MPEKTLSQEQREFTYMIAKFIEWAYSKGYELTFGHAWRDAETQARMVRLGLSKTLQSKHCDRLAVDFNLFIEGKYTDNPDDYLPLGKYWTETLGGGWGGDFKNFKDAGHFEYKK